MSDRVTDGQRQRHATVVFVAVADDVGYLPVTHTDDNLAVADPVDDAIDSVAVSDGGSERLDNDQSHGYSVRFSNR